MILEERSVQLNDVGNIFNIVAKELSSNIHTQIIISDELLKKLETNNSEYHVYFHNYFDVPNSNELYVLHENGAFSTEISKLQVTMFGNNYSQLIKFSFKGYDFSNEFHDTSIFYCSEHEIHRILVINLK